MIDVFKYQNYRPFLKAAFPRAGTGRGQRQQLAKALGCQTSFISLVLTDRVHMNEDMAFGTTQFLRLSKAESAKKLLSRENYEYY